MYPFLIYRAWKSNYIDNDNDSDDNENKFIAKVVQQKALQNAVHGIHIKTDKQEKKHIEESTLTKGAEVELLFPSSFKQHFHHCQVS